MENDELVILTQPYSNLLSAYGDLRADEYITDKQLAKLQRSVISESDAVVGFRLARENYLQKWMYKNNRRRDKWAQRDKVREMKAERKRQRKERKLWQTADGNDMQSPSSQVGSNEAK